MSGKYVYTCINVFCELCDIEVERSEIDSWYCSVCRQHLVFVNKVGYEANG